jgi:hypothetical protein
MTSKITPTTHGYQTRFQRSHHQGNSGEEHPAHHLRCEEVRRILLELLESAQGRWKDGGDELDLRALCLVRAWDGMSSYCEATFDIQSGIRWPYPITEGE